MVDPWIIYFMSLSNKLIGLSIFLTLASVIVGVVVYVTWCDAYDEEKRLLARKVAKYSAVVFVVAILMTIFLPTKSTLYTMLAVSYLTPENIEILRSFGIETVQQLTDAIVNSIENSSK